MEFYVNENNLNIVCINCNYSIKDNSIYFVEYYDIRNGQKKSINVFESYQLRENEKVRGSFCSKMCVNEYTNK